MTSQTTKLSPFAVFGLVHDAAVLDAAEAREASEAAKSVKYVDLSKMDEVYDRVRDWQETGKKKFS